MRSIAERQDALARAMKPFWHDAEPIGSHIAGETVMGTGNAIEIDDPVTGEILVGFQDAGASIASKAVDAAEVGFHIWSRVPHAERGRVLQAIAARIRIRAEELAQLEMIVSGKPIRDCRGEVVRVAEMFEYYAGWADKLHGEVIPVPGSHLNFTRREPFGVILQITPWNAPLFTAGWQVAPALAMGNGVVLKPSEQTPLTSLALARLAEEAGLSKGVLNVIAGYGHTASPTAIAHRAVKKIVFVGSPAVGKHIAAAAAAHLKPAVLELGGKSANIIFADADLNRAVLGAQAAIFAGAGQSCVAGSRLLIQRPVYEELLAAMSNGAARIKVGDPADPATEVGPINNRRQFQHVKAMIEGGVAEGARLIGSAEANGDGGYFVRPTIIANVYNQMDIAQEEVFGPVVAAIPFDTEEEAIAIANESRFGLAGAVWTNDIGRAHRVAAAVHAGTFWINSYKTINVASPFGGFDESGYGRSSGLEVLREYTQLKSIWVETAVRPATTFGYAPGLGI